MFAFHAYGLKSEVVVRADCAMDGDSIIEGAKIKPDEESHIGKWG